jgi:hypothetical protein
MGALKKKAGGKKPQKKGKATTSPILNVGDVSILSGDIQQMAEQFRAMLDAVEHVPNAESDDTAAIFTQDMMAMKLHVDAMTEAVSAAQDRFKEVAKKHYDENGVFESGQVAISFPEQSGTRPKWKDEALLQAKQVAGLQDKPFDEKDYLKTVTAKYPATVSRSVKLTVSVA